MSIFSKPTIPDNPEPTPEPQKVIPVQDLNQLVESLVDTLFENQNFLQQLNETIEYSVQQNGYCDVDVYEHEGDILDIVRTNLTIDVEIQ